MNNPKAILAQAASIIDQRGANYGGIESSFARAAAIAGLKMNKHITPHDVVVILESVKDARLAESPQHEDSLIDRINYAAFRAVFALQDQEGAE